MTVQSVANPESVYNHTAWAEGVGFHEILGSEESTLGIADVGENEVSLPCLWETGGIVLEGHMKMAELSAPGVVHDLPKGAIFNIPKDATFQVHGQAKVFFFSKKPLGVRPPDAGAKF